MHSNNSYCALLLKRLHLGAVTLASGWFLELPSFLWSTGLLQLVNWLLITNHEYCANAHLNVLSFWGCVILNPKYAHALLNLHLQLNGKCPTELQYFHPKVLFWTEVHKLNLVHFPFQLCLLSIPVTCFLHLWIWQRAVLYVLQWLTMPMQWLYRISEFVEFADSDLQQQCKRELLRGNTNIPKQHQVYSDQPWISCLGFRVWEFSGFDEPVNVGDWEFNSFLSLRWSLDWRVILRLAHQRVKCAILGYLGKPNSLFF